MGGVITQQKRAEEEKLLMQSVTRAIAEAPNFDSALEIALSRVVEAAGWDYGEAWVPGEGALELSPAYYTTRPELEKFRGESEGFIFQFGEGLPGRVWKSRKPEWIPNVSAKLNGYFPRGPIARKAGLKAGFGIPIVADGEVLAVVAFYMSEAREEDSRLVELVSAVASQLGTVVKRKKAEEELKKSEEKYRALMEKANDTVFILDLETGNILDANKMAVTLTGYSKNELMHMNVKELHPGKERSICEENFRKLAQRGSCTADSLHIKRKNGEIVPVDISASTLEVGGRMVVHDVIRDITERKRAEEELKETAEYLQNILDSSIDLIFTVKKDGTFKYFNRVLEDVTGYKEEELIGKNFMEFVPEGERELVKQKWEEINMSIAGTYETKIIRKDGTLADVLVSYSPLPSGDEFLAVMRDITDIKRAEEELREKSERIAVVRELDRLISSSLDIGVVYESFAEGVKRLVEYDRISVALYDGKREELTVHLVCSQEGCSLPGGSRVPLSGTVLGHVIEKGRPHMTRDTAREFPSDESFTAEGFRSSIAVPLISPSGTIGTFSVAKRESNAFTEKELKVLEDLGTQLAIAVENSRLYENLKHAHEELQSAYDELKGVDELKRNIIANVSHELRTPITVVKSVLELLRDEEDQAGRNALLENAKDALERQDLIVEDLLETSWMELDEGKPELVPLNIASLIEMASKEFRILARKHRIVLKHSIEGKLPQVEGDKKRLMHVLRNLVNNAIKFNSEGGEVTIEAREKDGMVEVCIADTGIGIAKEEQESVFERFYQVDSSATRRYGGTGMGLSIAREVVEAHGGEIWVESGGKDKGSTFCFTLLARGSPRLQPWEESGFF